MIRTIGNSLCLTVSTLLLLGARASAQQPTQISAGEHHTCARMSDGSARCWGLNDAGQLGNGTTTDSRIPVLVSGLASGVVAIAGGDEHSCALMSDGTVRCWGSNFDGQLGDGTTTQRVTPVNVIGVANALAVSASTAHSCALLSSGGVKCWGYNGDGQLGDGTTNDHLTAVSVSGITSAKRIEAGYAHSCAQLASGAVSCWGYNADGQLGNGGQNSSSTPVIVTPLAGATSIALGWDHGCALLSDASVRCWGYNADGEIGDGTTTSRSSPVATSGVTTATRLAAGYNHACVLLTDGSMRCWGSNSLGEIGDGTVGGLRQTPVAVVALSSPIIDIAVGHSHTCALRNDGLVQCWGANFAGQLGTGLPDDSALPVTVYGTGPRAVPWAAPWATLLLALLLATMLAFRTRWSIGSITQSVSGRT